MIGVHAGAGLNQQIKKPQYRAVCEAACNRGLECLRSGGSAIDAVTQALVALEDDPVTNAGLGSNFCLDGSIECDASLMDGSSLDWAGIGAISSIKNPILVARALLEEQKREWPMGLIPPHILVSEPARRWAQSKGFASANLSTDRSKSLFMKYKSQLERQEESSTFQHSGEKRFESDNATRKDCGTKRPRSVELNFQSRNTIEERLDTVGAVAIDSNGRSASGVSSGGIILKLPGRIGQAASYGAGIWAQDNVAVTTSGNGEYLMKTLFARECGIQLLGTKPENYAPCIDNLFKKSFTDSPYLKNVTIPKSAGIIALVGCPDEGSGELMWAHNTHTMAIGHSSLSTPFKFSLSELPHSSSMIFSSVSLKVSCNKRSISLEKL
ncbi:threonine aspartase 1-like [Brevipalpus obovatus]|uniref:threonine aspartase 1-like n=1 Tax=Brevipalpus obovatus TaxID=246614 RepID=UPI003D9EB7D5